MKVLLITGSNGWLGKAPIKEIVKSQLINKFQIIILINLTKIKSDNFEKKIAKSCIKKDIKIINLVGNLGQEIFQDIIHSNLKSLPISDLKVIAIASIIHPKNYHDFDKWWQAEKVQNLITKFNKLFVNTL